MAPDGGSGGTSPRGGRPLIPRVIHQTWRNHDLPKSFALCAGSWRAHNPEWHWRLWTDADNDAFVAAEYPNLLDVYQACPTPIQRVDIVRYLILHRLGGLFVDLDFEALRPIDALLTASAVFGCEPRENCKVHGRRRIVSNAFMAAMPGHALFTAIVSALPRCMARTHSGNPFTAILETTGPFFLSDAIEAYCGPDAIALMPPGRLYPLGIRDIEALRARGWTQDLRARVRDAWAVHYHSGTWWR